MGEDARKPKQVDRRSFIKASAGVATGAAVVAVPALAAEDGKPVPTEPTSPTPREPVMAYVRDAERGEVTVLSGTGETAYKDRKLVQRLLAAAPQPQAGIGGEADVIAP
jgi:hypothetical protein